MDERDQKAREQELSDEQINELIKIDYKENELIEQDSDDVIDYINERNIIWSKEVQGKLQNQLNAIIDAKIEVLKELVKRQDSSNSKMMFGKYTFSHKIALEMIKELEKEKV